MRAARFAVLVLSAFLSASGGMAQDDSRSAGQSGWAQQRQKAISLEQQNSFPAAEKAWRDLLQANPKSAEAYAHLGLLAARQENYSEAIPLYRKALALGPDLPEVHLNLGLALFKGASPKEAIAEFSRVLNSPGLSHASALRARLLIGMAHYAQGEYAQAVPYLKEAAAADPQNAAARLVLAHSCLWSKETQCVLDTYKEILTINPDSAEAYLLAGEAYDEMKNSDGAIRMFRAAVKANPREPNAHFGLGYLLWKQKIYPEAAVEFQAELANDPSHVPSMAYLGDTYLQLNKPAEARPILEKAAQLDASQPLAHLDLGIILNDAGENKEALRELLLAEKLEPGDVNVHWRLGRLYRSRGEKEKARIQFDKASTITKTADQDLLQKISSGREHPPADADGPH